MHYFGYIEYIEYTNTFSMAVPNILAIFLCLNLSASAGVHNPIDSNGVFLQSKSHWHLPLSHFKKLRTYEQRERSIYDEARPSITFCTDSNTCIVRAVYGGKVQAIFEVGDVYAIMVRYGNYFITYCGLSKPQIGKGDLIRESQVIGTLYTDSNTQDGELEIVLSDINRRQYDPEKWFDWKSMDRKLHSFGLLNFGKHSTLTSYQEKFTLSVAFGLFNFLFYSISDVNPGFLKNKNCCAVFSG